MPILQQTSDDNGRLLTVDHFSYTYPEAEKHTLRDISLVIRAGECHLLEGPTGCGKSTLLLAIRGLLPSGHSSGRITEHGAGDRTSDSRIALVQQNPTPQLLKDSLGADIAFGLENRCEPPEQMLEKVQNVLSRTGLDRPVDFPVDALSMGQQYRACIAGQLVLEPRLVLLDEPVAQLDPHGRVKMMELIRQLKAAGVAVLICEHRPDILLSLIDHSWGMSNSGRLVNKDDRGITPATAPQLIATKQQCTDRSQELPGNEPAIVIRKLRVEAAGCEVDLSQVAIEVAKGECVVLHGPNGSGKTTLIRVMAGLLQPKSGVVKVFGKSPSPASSCGMTSVLFQNPKQQLFETSVFDEVAFAARRSGMKESEVTIWVELLLEKLGIAEMAIDSPHKLSYGQKHLVGFAAVLAGRPEIVLLDDPFAGLDSDKVGRVKDLLSWLVAERAMTVVWTTHDSAAVTGGPVRCIELAGRPKALVSESPQRQSAIPRKRGEKRRKNPTRSVPAIGTGPMLVITILLSMLAFGARSFESLLGLSLINLLLLFLFSQAPTQVLRKSVLFFTWQSLLVVLLYVIRFGYGEGMLPGFQVAGQLFLAFWPGMIFMSSNSQASIARTFSRVLPLKTAFVASVCLRFLPTLLTEMQTIREVQILRGARLGLSDLKKPGYWPDWISCLTIPTLIATLSLATEIATAAAARDFGCQDRRTSWPGD